MALLTLALLTVALLTVALLTVALLTAALLTMTLLLLTTALLTMILLTMAGGGACALGRREWYGAARKVKLNERAADSRATSCSVCPVSASLRGCPPITFGCACAAPPLVFTTTTKHFEYV